MQKPLKYTCLFGGGAIRGLAYIGVIRALEELNIEIDMVGGSSVGAIFASLIASGYKSYELEKIFIKVNHELFKDIHLGTGINFAISKGEIFVDWINELLNKKFEKSNGENVTFNDLENELVIITTDIKTFKPVEFSKKQTPDFEVAKAIRISSSMPGLMPPFEYEGLQLVDGDLQKASPMWKLSNSLKNSESNILEFRLEGEYNKKNSNSPLAYINSIYSCMTDVATEFVTEIYGKNDRYDYIKINSGDIFFADFNLNKDARRKLIETGYNSTMQYFKQILPKKKQEILEVYNLLSKYLKNIDKGIKFANVDEVQWWLGDIYILLAENKEIVDPVLYNMISNMKYLLQENIQTVLFFHNKLKNTKYLRAELQRVLIYLDLKIMNINLYLQQIS